jgi:hypothetical protein
MTTVASTVVDPDHLAVLEALKAAVAGQIGR